MIDDVHDVKKERIYDDFSFFFFYFFLFSFISFLFLLVGCRLGAFCALGYSAFCAKVFSFFHHGGSSWVLSFLLCSRRSTYYILGVLLLILFRGVEGNIVCFLLQWKDGRMEGMLEKFTGVVVVVGLYL